MLRIKKQYIKSILNGTKTQTTRKQYFNKTNKDFFLCGDQKIDIIVTSVYQKHINNFTLKEAQDDGFETLEEFQNILKQYYSYSTSFTVIQFELADKNDYILEPSIDYVQTELLI